MCHLQWSRCNIGHLILSMLLHYLGKLDIVKSGRQCKQNALIFTSTHFNGFCLLSYNLVTYYRSLWLLLNIFFKQHIGHATLQDFLHSLHLFYSTRSVVTKPPRFQLRFRQDIWGIVQQPVNQLPMLCSSFRPGSTCLHLSTCVGKCGRLNNIMTILMSFKSNDIKCFTFGAQDMIFKLYFLQLFTNVEFLTFHN